MLSNESCTNVYFSFRDTKENEKIIIAKYQTIEELGNIIGCAIYFKENDKAKEYIAGTNLKGDHGDVLRYVISEHKFRISLSDNENTCYGYITDKNYFLNRSTALIVYKRFCEVNNLVLPDQIATKLFSYQINWGSVLKNLNFKS